MSEMQRFLPPQTDSNESPVVRGVCRRRLPTTAAGYALTDLVPASLFPLAPRDRGHVGAVRRPVSSQRRDFITPPEQALLHLLYNSCSVGQPNENPDKAS